MHKVKVPASVASLDLDRVRRALFKADGNVTKAAKSLKVSSADLRRLTWRHPTLIMDALERVHCQIDKAEENLTKALRGDHPERSLRASCSFCRIHLWLARAAGVRHVSDSSDYLYSPSPTVAPVKVIWQGDMPVGYKPSLPAVPEARRSADTPSSSSVDSEGNGRVH